MKKIFYGILRIIIYSLYPFVWIYNRYLASIVDEMVGSYWGSRISNRGKDLRIHGQVKILNPERLKIGNFCRIGKGAFFFCYGGLTIGNNVQFSRNITIYTANHDYKGSVLPYTNEYIVGPVVIGDNTWIGMNVSILPNVNIGKNAIVGMNAVITKDVPDNAIVVGNNRIVGYRSTNQLIKSEGKYFGELYPDA